MESSVFLRIILLSTLLFGCAKKETPDVHKETAQPVSVTVVSKEDLQEYLSYSGDIEAEDAATVYSKVTGKLVENKVQEGDPVQKGEMLASVDRDEVGYDFELAPVVSPIAGLVGRTYLDKGANITLSTPIALIVNIDQVQVKIDVIEKELPKVLKGQSAEITVDAYPNKVFRGQVQKASPVVDLQTRTAPAWIGISNLEHALKPGMFARLKLKVKEHKDVLTIMRDAVIEEDSQRYVFILENNRAYKRKVKLGFSSDGTFQILEGLKLGEQVIVMRPSDLKDGDLVRVVGE